MASVISFPRREVQAVSLIGFAHMLSHIYPLALAPLLIPITDSLQMTTVEWGTALAVFAITTGVLQTPVGFLVERVGGRKVLTGGLVLFAAAYFLIGWQASSFWQLLGLMAIAGIGNSVFHPADYSLISSSVGEERLGRAFSMHTFVGHIGFLVGPVLAASLEPFVGWRGAMIFNIVHIPDNEIGLPFNGKRVEVFVNRFAKAIINAAKALATSVARAVNRTKDFVGQAAHKFHDVDFARLRPAYEVDVSTKAPESRPDASPLWYLKACFNTAIGELRLAPRNQAG